VLKGIPLLLKAWEAAGLKDAELELVGGWRLAAHKKQQLPPNCRWRGPVSGDELRRIYAKSNVFVFPTLFEGFGMVVLEAMAAGLPVMMTAGQGAAEVVDSTGRLFPADDLDALVDSLRWFDAHRDDLPALSAAARARAETCTWTAYRESVVEAVRPYV
jgi:glycosyltransferase involved in cell wall biosynthesis